LEFNVPFQHKYGYIRDDPHFSGRGTLVRYLGHVQRLWS